MAEKKTKRKTAAGERKATPRAKKIEKRDSSTNQVLAIVGLLLNLLILPGLGSIIGGKIKEGISQIVILFGSLILGIGLIIVQTTPAIIIGVLVIVIGALVAWIWGIVTGVRMIQSSS